MRTWLLAAIAGWALLLWALAIFGMGGRIHPLPVDESLATALPPPSAASRLPPHTLSQYSESTARPLFFNDRRPKPFSLQPGGDAPAQNTFEYVLSSVLIAPGLKMAILQPQAGGESIRLKLGEDSEKLPGWRLTELSPRSATFASAGDTRVLDLRVFDGSSGQPPTPQPSPLNVQAPTQATMPVPSASAGSAAQRGDPAARGRTSQQVEPAPVSAEQPAAQQDANAPSPNEVQMQAIRQRIEARRARLRQEAQQAAKPKQ